MEIVGDLPSSSPPTFLEGRVFGWDDCALGTPVPAGSAAGHWVKAHGRDRPIQGGPHPLKAPSHL